MRLVSGVSMVLLVFGGKAGLFRLALIFFAVSAAFGGAIFALTLMTGGGIYDGQMFFPISLKVLVVAFALCYGVMSLVFARLGRNTGAKLVKVEITRRGKSVALTGLIDTGNSLVDPITGGSVLVAETAAVQPLFKPETASKFKTLEVESPVELLPKLQNTPDGLGLYLIPYTAVGTGSGFLLAFRPDIVEVNEKIQQGISIALSPTRVSDGGRYSVLVNAELCL